MIFCVWLCRSVYRLRRTLEILHDRRYLVLKQGRISRTLFLPPTFTRDAADAAADPAADPAADLLSRIEAAGTPPEFDEQPLPAIPDALLQEAVEPPSYVVDDSSQPSSGSSSSAGTLGAPSESMLGSVEPLPESPSQSLPDPAVAVSETPPTEATLPAPAIDDASGMVAYRSDAAQQPAADDLPAGMADRLRLDEGVRYTDTPYPIGNFLKILEAWEASEQH